MRWGVCIIAIGLLGGCASRRSPATQPAALEYRAAAGALVFDPPVAANQPALALDRDSRVAGAFVGYDSTITTYHYLRIDDRFTFDRSHRGDRYERRAVSYRVGVSRR